MAACAPGSATAVALAANAAAASAPVLAPAPPAPAPLAPAPAPAPLPRLGAVLDPDWDAWTSWLMVVIWLSELKIVFDSLPLPLQCAQSVLALAVIGFRMCVLWHKLCAFWHKLPVGLQMLARSMVSAFTWFEEVLLLVVYAVVVGWPAIASRALVACPTMNPTGLGMDTLATLVPNHNSLIEDWCAHEMALLVSQQNPTEFPLAFDHHKYLTELCIYSHRLPVEDTLIVTGPRHSGKTFGVLQLESYWQQQASRAVITLDLKGMEPRGDKRVNDTFRELWQDVNAQLHTLLQQHFTDNQRAAYHTCQLRARRVPRPPIANATYFEAWLNSRKAVYAADVAELRSVLFGQLTDVSSFWELLRVLEWFARLGGGRFSPLLIVREVERLGSLDSHLASLLNALTSRRQRESVVPVILETSDSRWLAHEKSLHSPSWDVLYVGELDQASVRRNVVDRWRLVSQETFDRIWSYSGGFGLAFANVIDELRVDPLTDVSEIILTLQDRDFAEFTLSLEAAQQCGRPGCEQAQLSVLTRLAESATHSDSQRQWRIAKSSMDLEHQLAVQDLVRHNLLYVRPCRLDGAAELCVEPACFTWRAQIVSALKRRAAMAGTDSQDKVAHE